MAGHMEQGTVSDMPLLLLFPGAAASEIDLIRAAATALEQARPTTGDARWWWHLPHATFPGPGNGGVPVILCTAVTFDGELCDWTELEIDVAWTGRGLWEVTAQFGIACHCDTDHGTHFIHRLSTATDDSGTLASALEDAARSLIGWIAGPTDPSHWRAAAGLPSSTR